MPPGDPGRLTFCLEWYDTTAFLKKKFLLFCYSDETTELFDLKSRKTFLRRHKCPSVLSKDIYIGAILNIYQRQMEVIGYGDEFTRKSRQLVKERTFCMIKPDTVDKMSYIFETIEANGLTISKLKTATMTKEHALQFYKQHKGKAFLPGLVNHVTSGPVLAMELVGNSAIKKWMELMGNTDSVLARKVAPESLRARFGTDLIKNGVHGADSSEGVEHEIRIFFPSGLDGSKSPVSSASFGPGVTCCIIKPHMVKETGSLGSIICTIQEHGFHIGAIQMFQLDLHNAEEFLQVYKGVVPSYQEMVQELCSGPCIVLEISGFGDETQKKFRELVGPSDPDIAKRLRPNTLRGRFAKTQHENAVHCTDLPEDGLMECEFFFCLMQQS